MSPLKPYIQFLIFCSTALPGLALAQSAQDLTGRVYKERPKIATSGSPFLADKWAKGIVVMKDGKELNGIDLKFDVEANTLLYRDESGQVLEMLEAPREFKILFADKSSVRERHFKKDFKAGKDTDQSTYFEVIYDGTNKFLARNLKVFFEERDYSGVATKRMIDKTNYYIVTPGNSPVVVSRDVRSISAVLGKSSDELQTYVRSEKLNLKNDDDIAKLFVYLEK